MPWAEPTAAAEKLAGVATFMLPEVFVHMDALLNGFWNARAFRLFLAMLAITIAGAGIIATSGQATAKSGKVKKSFGTNGRTFTGFEDSPDEGRLEQMALRPDGTTMILGSSRQDMVLAAFS
ncbi:MAG: hypothetical protein WBW62_03405, partial [Solirubrobacterales bacterium]